MIRFRNPGTQYSTQIQVFRELYKEYKNAESFSLENMADTIARCSLMTAYGYAGEAALSLSDTDNSSLNSTLMNAKMYAEVFRLLGWICSVGNRSYPLVFTYIGAHAALSNDVLPLYEQCVLGINNPQEMMNVKYSEQLRFFKTALRTMIDLNGIMYKHELCLGPMGIDDVDETQYSAMIHSLKSLRGSYRRYSTAYADLCDTLGVKKELPDNSTRLPIAFMKTCGWVETERHSDLYPPKSLECLVITDHGRELVNQLMDMYDLRLNEFNSYNTSTQDALIRLGVFSMLSRSGYDVTPMNYIITEDLSTCDSILHGKDLLFSPYQTLKRERVEKALGIIREAGEVVERKVAYSSVKKSEAVINSLPLCVSVDPNLVVNDAEIESFKETIEKYKRHGESFEEIVDHIFTDYSMATEPQFYPFIATLFRVLGLNCHASRRGDNGARWDLIIIHDSQSIPVEVKSPTEVRYVSLKAIRQACENKIMLLSRKTHPTKPETTTLAVGYTLPNDRTEISRLIQDFKTVYGINIGVFDTKTLIKIAASTIENGLTINMDQFFEMEGYADANT